ncbi:hypothetical protein Lal_00033240 [Lupinus albus]|nr:hypothetical protein Lal_00033240 [Lupinus albus]
MASNFRKSRPFNHRKPPLVKQKWVPTMPQWEKMFCSKVGAVPWRKLVEAKKYLSLHENVMNLDDFACTEAFGNAKNKFSTSIKGIPCTISLPDPEIYIDDIHWNSIVDDELIMELESETNVPIDEVVVILDPKCIGWGDAEVFCCNCLLINYFISNYVDKIVWQGTSDSYLPLKVAYKTLSQFGLQRNWCKWIWSEAIPPSKSFTIWRLFNKRMRMDENLQRRGCSLASICSLCKENSETSDHNWLIHHFDLAWDKSYITLLLCCNSQWSPQAREVLVASIYCRNQYRFQDKILLVPHALIRIKSSIALFGNSINLCSSNSIKEFFILRSLNIAINHSKAPKISEVIWKPPSSGWIKVNIDWDAHGALEHSGGGAIFRDHMRKFVACFANYLDIQDAMYAELHTAILAIELAAQKGWKSLWIECDSTMVVDTFNESINPPWKLWNRWLLCKNLLSRAFLVPYLCLNIKIS